MSNTSQPARLCAGALAPPVKQPRRYVKPYNTADAQRVNFPKFEALREGDALWGGYWWCQWVEFLQVV